MKRLLLFIYLHYKSPLLLLLFAVCTVLLRMLISNSFFYAFLLWNLFLALLPYLITQTVSWLGMESLKRPIRLLFLFGWLLLLPNSPYMITDLIHLQSVYSTLEWIDLFVVFVLAFTGLLFGKLSMLDVHVFLSRFINPKKANTILLLFCLLSGYGIYLGRFLRFNSWDVVFNTKAVFMESVYSLGDTKVWFMVFGYGLFFWSVFLFFRWMKGEGGY